MASILPSRERRFGMRLICNVVFLGCMVFVSCKKDVGVLDFGYPKEVGKIITYKCATQGCHNSESFKASAGLDLSTWEAMFRGSNANSSVIPFRADQSFLAFSVNTFDELGPKLAPSMPLNKTPLTYDEILVIKNWINSGAPDNKGNVKFADNPNQRKIYVTNQGCDLVTVFDAQSKLIMRAVDVGVSPQTEAPHDMMTSPDGEYYYISFYTSNLFQKFRTSDNALVGQLTLPDYSWHSINISGDSKIAITTHLNSNGKIALINLDEMKIISWFAGSVYPHGCILNYNGSLGYVTSQQGNFIYKIDLTDMQNPIFTEVPLATGQVPIPSGTHKPYSISYFPDYSKYAITCQGTNELRIFDAAKDSLLKVIPTNGVPQLMSFSKKLPYLFVSCMEDSANMQTSSSVNVINYNALQLIGNVFTGYQPRGLAVDDDNNCVWVANRNILATGWSPHHTTSCNGRNGYVTIIDMKTLKLIPGWKTELSVDPYCISIRK